MPKSPADLLSDLLPFEERVFPRATLEEIIARQEEMPEPLLSSLGEILANPRSGKWEDTVFPIFVVYLLAQFRETRALDPLTELLALPDDLPSHLFGDMISEGMGNVLASLHDGDEGPLRRLIENPNASEHVRGGCVPSAYAALVANELIPAAAVESYFLELLDSRLERVPGLVWDSLSLTAATMGFASLLPAIVRAFEEGLCNPGYCSLEEIEDLMEWGGEEGWQESAGLIDDLIGELETWHCFQPTLMPRLKVPTAGLRARPAAPPKPVVGRNDPCPCGSGKKFKKCCGDEAAAAAVARAARAEAEAGTLHLRIELAGSVPLIWRELLVPGTFTLADLHRAIQRVMPWDNDHVHGFSQEGSAVAFPAAASPIDSLEDEYRIFLHQFVGTRHPLVYTYDFGDSWEHLITVSRGNESIKRNALPACTGGENSAPPENTGGIWRYNHMIAALEDDDREDCGDILEWLGDDFDPCQFDRAAADQALSVLRKRGD